MSLLLALQGVPPPADIIFGFFDEIESDIIEEVDGFYISFVDEPANEPIFGFSAGEDLESEVDTEVFEFSAGAMFDVAPVEETIVFGTMPFDEDSANEPDIGSYDSIAIAALAEQPAAVVSEWIIRARRRGRH